MSAKPKASKSYLYQNLDWGCSKNDRYIYLRRCFLFEQLDKDNFDKHLNVLRVYVYNVERHPNDKAVSKFAARCRDIHKYADDNDLGLQHDFLLTQCCKTLRGINMFPLNVPKSDDDKRWVVWEQHLLKLAQFFTEQ